MYKKIMIIASSSLLSILIVSCGGDSDDVKKITVKKVEQNKVNQSSGKRWYTTAQVMRGKKVFKENCAECHGDKAQGLAADWKKPQADGKYPPPPLNGSAHAWHHSKEALLRTINMGGIPIGGSMPSFKDKLTDKEKEAVLAYISSLWPDEIYSAWSKRNPK